MNTYRKFVKFRVVRSGGMGFRSDVYELTDWIPEEEADKLRFQYGIKYGNDSDFQELVKYQLIEGTESKEFDKGKAIHELMYNELYEIICPYMVRDLRPELDFCFPSGGTIINGYSRISISINEEDVKKDFKPIEYSDCLFSNKGYYLLPIYNKDGSIFVYIISNMSEQTLCKLRRIFTKKLREIY